MGKGRNWNCRSTDRIRAVWRPEFPQGRSYRCSCGSGHWRRHKYCSDVLAEPPSKFRRHLVGREDVGADRNGSLGKCILSSLPPALAECLDPSYDSEATDQRRKREQETLLLAHACENMCLEECGVGGSAQGFCRLLSRECVHVLKTLRATGRRSVLAHGFSCLGHLSRPAAAQGPLKTSSADFAPGSKGNCPLYLSLERARLLWLAPWSASVSRVNASRGHLWEQPQGISPEGAAQ